MANTTPIYWNIVCDYFILRTTPFIIVLSSSVVVLASCIARIAILWASWSSYSGHFELWALLFFPLMFHDDSVIPFFFPSLPELGFIYIFIYISYSSIFISSYMSLFHSRKGSHWLFKPRLFMISFCVFWFSGGGHPFILCHWPGSFRCGYEVIKMASLITLCLHSLLLCPCTQAGTIDKSTGVARLHPSLPPFPLWHSGQPEARCVIESQICIPICWCSSPHEVVKYIVWDLVSSLF